VDTATSQPGELTLSLPSAQPSLAIAPALGASETGLGFASASALTPALILELWLASESASFGLTLEELSSALAAIGERYNYNQPAETDPTAAQRS